MILSADFATQITLPCVKTIPYGIGKVCFHNTAIWDTALWSPIAIDIEMWRKKVRANESITIHCLALLH